MGNERVLFFWSCSFGFGCTVQRQCFLGLWHQHNHTGTGMETVANGPRTGESGHSRPAEKCSFWWPVVLIFLVLCQTCRASYLYVDQQTVHRAAIRELFLVLVQAAASRLRCCVQDGGNLGKGGGSSNSERYRSCSVSIQTVVVVSETSSVLPCPRTGRPGYA